MSEDIHKLLWVAREAAEAASAVLRRHFQTAIAVRTKADGSPVTEADEAAEAVIREVIAQHFPDHGFYGEETGEHAMDRPIVWLVDPLDGTKSFVRGTPFFSTQIAAMTKGQVAVGVSVAPIFDETAWAARGEGAWLNGEPIAVSTVDRVDQAAISTGNIGSLARSTQWSALGRLLGEAGRTRGYGDFCHYHMLAAGRLDAVIESDVNILDIAALSLIVEMAGGAFTDLQGRTIGLRTDSVLAANAALHPLVLERLNG